jgi:hypothetical protein
VSLLPRALSAMISAFFSVDTDMSFTPRHREG